MALETTEKTARRRYMAPPSTRVVALSEVPDVPANASARMAAPNVFVAGDERLFASRRVAIVGARDATEAGLSRARRLARELTQAGVVVVSGLAKGVDYAAHTAAIQANGRTIAVLGTPLDKCYPAEHAELQEQIWREHLLVSQFKSGERVFPSSFPERNKLMAALSHATVIVEASDKSGTLHQAAECTRMGRPLFIMRSVADNKDLAWPARFLRPIQGRAAMILDSSAQVIKAIE